MEQAKFYMSRWYAFDNFSAFEVSISRLNTLPVTDIFWHPVFKTVEHAYQFFKFVWNTNSSLEASSITAQGVRGKIHAATSAHEAKQIAKENKQHVRDDWDQIKVAVMAEILLAKFEQHEYVRRSLERSIGMELIEDSPIDNFWGRGPDHDGENWMGRLWMQIRDEKFSS
jgi:ribA/ribD-fused uncharacterized protein